MRKKDFVSLCAKASKEGPVASWVTTDIYDHSLRRQYLAIRSLYRENQWKVYSFREGEGVRDLGVFKGSTPLEVYKAVPREVLA